MFSTPGPGPPRRPRRPVPAVGRVRLPARQVRARLQHPRRRDRRQLHRPERPVLRLRRPDRPVRARRGVPRGRRVHARAVAARPDHRASGSSPRSSSAGSTRRPSSASRSSRTSSPRRSAYIAQQHRDDPARLRARRLGGPAVHGRRAAHRRTLIDDEADTFANARLWDYRPLRTTPRPAPDRPPVLRLHRRRHRPLPIDDVQRQVMLSGRELALEQNPSATGWVNQRIIYTHGIGVGDGARSTRSPTRASRDLFIGNLPPVSTDRRPDDHRAADLLRRAAAATTSWSAPGRPSSTTRPARATRPAAGRRPRRAGPGRPGITLDTTLDAAAVRARFRDLDLLISDQVTADSQLLFHRSLGDRLELIAPFR